MKWKKKETSQMNAGTIRVMDADEMRVLGLSHPTKEIDYVDSSNLAALLGFHFPEERKTKSLVL